MSFIMGSAVLLKPLEPVLPFLSGFRHPALSGLLAVPGIFALAAYGLDGLIRLPWPQVDISRRFNRSTAGCQHILPNQSIDSADSNRTE